MLWMLLGRRVRLMPAPSSKNGLSPLSLRYLFVPRTLYCDLTPNLAHPSKM